MKSCRKIREAGKEGMDEQARNLLREQWKMIVEMEMPIVPRRRSLDGQRNRKSFLWKKYNRS